MILVTLPMRTVSAMNTREHHMARYRRSKAQRTTVALALRPAVGNGFGKKHERLVITLTRIGIRQGLDGDNLQASFKAIRDSVAEVIGIDDGSDRVEWRYAQRRGPAWGIEIAIATPEEMAA